MATVPAWWLQGATQINPLDQTWSGGGDSPGQSERFTMNNYDAILRQLGFGGDWLGGAPDDPSQGAFKAQDVQDWLASNGYQMMANQGTGIGGGADTYQNLNWIQDAQGNMAGDPTFNRDDPNGVLKMAALAAAGYFGGGALAGAGEAGAGAAGAAAGGADAATTAAWANGAGLGADTVGAVGGGSAAGAGSLAPLAGIEGMGVTVAPTMTNSALAASGTLSPELAAIAAGGPMAGAAAGGAGAASAGAGGGLWDTVARQVGGGRNLAGLIGAAAGAIDAKNNDKPTTSVKDPWAAAVPFLQQQLQQGQQLSAQYAAHPFSQAQQTAYGNLGGLLDSINGGGMAGLLSGMGANASGANQYSRANPGRQLLGGAASLPNWQPGLLGNFGTKG